MGILAGQILNRGFYLNPTLDVARNLLGCVLVVAENAQQLAAHTDNGAVNIPCAPGFTIGRIVETEAYLGEADSACHSYKKRPGGRTNIMFGMGGHAYIYLIYGMYYCLNTVTLGEGCAQGVLIRALEPLCGDDIKRYSGPGKLCRESAIDKDDYGTDLTGGGRIIIVKPDNFAAPNIGISSRVGVENKGQDGLLPYRFFDKSSRSVSAARKVQFYK